MCGDLRKDVELNFGEVDLLSNEFSLFQNQPNPFSQETVIGFHLPEATEATLTIFDLAGQLVWAQTKNYDTGVHQVVVSKDKLVKNGVYYYKLSTTKSSATRRMVLLR